MNRNRHCDRCGLPEVMGLTLRYVQRGDKSELLCELCKWKIDHGLPTWGERRRENDRKRTV